MRNYDIVSNYEKGFEHTRPRRCKRIAQAILNGSIKLGVPLRQEALSARLGISRTPLRQALLLLGDEGLVVNDDFRGARVTEVNIGLVDDLFDMRRALEPIALTAAFEHQTKIDFARAEMALDAAAETVDPARLSSLNWGFHHALYAPCKRVVLLQTTRRLNRYSALAEVIALSISARIGPSQQEHIAILQALRARDLDAATTLLNQHLSAAHQDARAAL